MKINLKELFRKSEISETAAEPPQEGMENLIKMKEATRLIKASAPTVRKYAWLGCYNECRFGAKLVFYNKAEILNFILKGGHERKSKCIDGNPIYVWVIQKITPNPFLSYYNNG